MSSLIYIKNANQLITVCGASEAPKTGKAMSELGIVKNGSLILQKDQIIFVGEDRRAQAFLRSSSGEVTTLDAAGKIVMPGLVDPHTHLVFAGSREHELDMRLNGASYMDILEAGGGILIRLSKQGQPLRSNY